MSSREEAVGGEVEFVLPSSEKCGDTSDAQQDCAKAKRCKALVEHVHCRFRTDDFAPSDKYPICATKSNSYADLGDVDSSGLAVSPMSLDSFATGPDRGSCRGASSNTASGRF